MSTANTLGALGYSHNRLLLIHYDWLQKMISEKAVPQNPFPKHSDFSDEEIKAFLLDSKAPPSQIENSNLWRLLSVEEHPLKKELVYPSFLINNTSENSNLNEESCFSEMLEYVESTNFIGSWHEGFEKYNSSFKIRNEFSKNPWIPKEGENAKCMQYTRALLHLITRIYQCPIIDARSKTREEEKNEYIDYCSSDCKQDWKQPLHIDHVLVAILCDEDLILLKPYREFNIKHALRFSPTFLGDTQCPLKMLFVVYQILEAVNHLHSIGVALGYIQLHDIKIDQHYLVTIQPDVESSLISYENESHHSGEESPYNGMSKIATKLIKSLETIPGNVKSDEDTTTSSFLATIVKMWISGTISNFDYLMILNYLAGRTFDNPNYYPVLPWVRDFSNENGGWRDLSKSKYRLNKGDQQLDLTYDGQKSIVIQKTKTHEDDDDFLLNQRRSIETPPHHISDVLSEITYYVYKARITSKNVLCKHVRNRWVPAEYPSSMQRLQAWTPDECIPEFYTDPSIFKSVHSDLNDLELPEWCEGSTNKFIEYHRSSLESDYVSERLHQWIDLTFGYKLSGSSAVRAKNVCLHLVDRLSELRRHGVIQLFTHPHPVKQTGYSTYWTSNASRLLSNMRVQKMYSELELDDDIEQQTDSLGKVINESKRSSTSSMSDTGSLSKSKLPFNSDAEGTRHSILFPKDCDMSAAINELDNFNAFLFKNGENPKLETNAFKNTSRSSKTVPKITSCEYTDMEVVGCLILELYVPQKFVGLGSNANIDARIDCSLNIIKNELHTIPLLVRTAVTRLLKVEDNLLEETTNHYSFSSISKEGLPPPSAQQLLHPTISPLPFPKSFYTFAKILRMLNEIQLTQEFQTDQSVSNKEIEHTVAEVQVKMVAVELSSLLEDIPRTQLKLILPVVKSLFQGMPTQILAVWFLFEPISKALGPSQTRIHFLEYILNIYEQSAQTLKHLKLYHRTFLLNLIVRLGMKTFLKYFITYIIEAVGGYKDFDDGISKEGLARSWNTVGITNPSSPAASPERMIDSTTSTPTSDEKSIQNVKNNEFATITHTKPDDQKTPGEEFNEGEIFSFDNAINRETFQNEIEDTKLKGVVNDSSLVSPQPILVPSSCDTHSDSLDTQDNAENQQYKTKDGNISDIALESVIWLSHRLGPVLSAKYLSRNLLKMLNLCYIGPDGFSPTVDKFQDQKIRISRSRVKGDVLAQNVLESLSGLVSLYGEQLILLQYLPYAWDLISICRQKRGGKLTPNLEGGLLGCLSLVHHMIPYLSSDSVLMNELSDGLLARVLFPVLQVATSRCLIFTGGWRPRNILIYKLLDVVYLIGLRIGEEMARLHLTPICSALFAAFDKAYDPCGNKLKSENEAEQKTNDINSSPSAMLIELSQVLVPELAYDVYVTFYHLVGRAHLDSNVPNLDLIQVLCSAFKEKDAIRPITFAHFRQLHAAVLSQDSPNSPMILAASSGSRGGNMISVGSDVTNAPINNPKMSVSSAEGANRSAKLHSLISKDGSSTERHLKGNWLAYWEHETGRPETEQHFVFKQILLQSFVGHNSGGGVKAIHVLDNENSFLSGGGSKDRTVKIWSLRSQGDGTNTIGPQWTYSSHKKSISNVSFLESLRLAVSCDTTVHVWDPFVGSAVHQIDSTRLGPISVMATQTADGHYFGPGSSCIWVATTNDNMVHTVDCRMGEVTADFKVCVGSVGLVKSICIMPDGNTISIGHSTGFISQLDIRTGKLRQSWKGHEGEIITLTPLNNSEFVSTSLDQAVTVWSNPEGKFRCSLPVGQDAGPIHCTSVNGDEIIMGSTANRIIVRKGPWNDHQHETTNLQSHNSHKLKADIVKTSLTSMKLLPMNKLLLLGQENGTIRLVC